MIEGGEGGGGGGGRPGRGARADRISTWTFDDRSYRSTAKYVQFDLAKFRRRLRFREQIIPTNSNCCSNLFYIMRLRNNFATILSHTTSSKSPKTTGICKIFILKFMDKTNNHSGLPYSTVDKTTERLELFELKLPEKTAQKVLIPSVPLKRCMFGYKQTTCSSRMRNLFGTFKQARKLCSISISTAKGGGESCYSCPSLVL